MGVDVDVEGTHRFNSAQLRIHSSQMHCMDNAIISTLHPKPPRTFNENMGIAANGQTVIRRLFNRSHVHSVKLNKRNEITIRGFVLPAAT